MRWTAALGATLSAAACGGTQITAREVFPRATSGRSSLLGERAVGSGRVVGTAYTYAIPRGWSDVTGASIGAIAQPADTVVVAPDGVTVLNVVVAPAKGITATDATVLDAASSVAATVGGRRSSDVFHTTLGPITAIGFDVDHSVGGVDHRARQLYATWQGREFVVTVDAPVATFAIAAAALDSVRGTWTFGP